MGDPHVKTLYYRVKHDSNIDYTRAQPLIHNTTGFDVTLADGLATIGMHDHYATREEARKAVEPFLRAWELSAILEYGPGHLKFRYDHSDVVDRNPTPGVTTLYAEGAQLVIMGGSAEFRFGHGKYPPPPISIALDDTVRFMRDRYCALREGKTTLSDAAYFCLTALERAAGGRDAAAAHYALTKKLLATIGDLTANKGGKEARKADGMLLDFSPAEQHWLEAALKAMLRRAAEVAYDPTAAHKQITMADLPTL